MAAVLISPVSVSDGINRENGADIAKRGYIECLDYFIQPQTQSARHQHIPCCNINLPCGDRVTDA